MNTRANVKIELTMWELYQIVQDLREIADIDEDLEDIAVETKDFRKQVLERLDQTLNQQMFGCVDCAAKTNEIGEYYMVHNHVWTQTGLGGDDGMLCIGCLETRIGRQLVRTDFTSAPINHFVEDLSERLRDRLGYANEVAA